MNWRPKPSRWPSQRRLESNSSKPLRMNGATIRAGGGFLMDDGAVAEMAMDGFCGNTDLRQ